MLPPAVADPADAGRMGKNRGLVVGFCCLPPLPVAAGRRGDRQGWGTQFVFICRKKQKKGAPPAKVPEGRWSGFVVSHPCRKVRGKDGRAAM